MSIRCWKCHTEKPEESFNWENKSLGKRKRICRDCMRDYHHKWFRQSYKYSPSRKSSQEIQKAKIQRAREYVADYLKSHPCIDCGISNIVVLDFDHIDKVAGYKEETRVCRLVNRGYSAQRTDEELAKCVVRCANCHRIKTANEQKWYKAKLLNNIVD